MILCGKHGNRGIHEFPAKVSSGIPKKDQLFICLFAPQTEVPLPHVNSADFMEFHEIWEFHDFMAKCELHVKITRKQPFVPEAENDSKTYAFLHGSGAVGQLFTPEL